MPGDAEAGDGREQEKEKYVYNIVWGLESPEFIGIRVEFLSYLTEKILSDLFLCMV